MYNVPKITQKAENLAQDLRSELIDEATEEFLVETAPLIGQIVQSFNAIESMMDNIICKMICSRSDQIGGMVIVSMPFGQKLKLLERFITNYDILVRGLDTSSKEGLDFVNALNHAAELRNLVVHVDYESTKDGFFFNKLKSNKQKGVQEKHVLITAKGLVEIVEFIESIWDVIDQFSETYDF